MNIKKGGDNVPFVIIAAVIAIICVARYYHNKKERNKEITWQEVQKQTDTEIP